MIAPVSVPATAPAIGGGGERLAVLDGWRALSILLVIAAHWLPLDPFLQGANAAAGAGGMALFFTLSGFLITGFMIKRPEPRAFLIRRVLRIVPLAWLAVAILFMAAWVQDSPAATPQHLVANLLFFGNLPPARLFPGGEHLWSLAVEMHFYGGIALLVAVGGRRSLFVLPLLAAAVTGARIAAGETISIVTWHRVDEILAGAVLALVCYGLLGDAARRALAAVPFWAAVVAAVLCVWFIETPLAYARPYAVALLVGVTLLRVPRWLGPVLTSAPAAYIAQISYALYVFHLMLGATWLGSGDTLEKYLKRPLLALATWAAAHLSTFHFEQRFTDWARQITRPRGAVPLRAY
ncbi:acyltransferase [Erythrobacteraceae bacterium CFH 75059]|uniref:acyltransferase family protein n=1 Tax=Qipengyuania thermophila TaxID=2509361 RepID=UPI001021EFF1|nr:acyltransferase [Qipengyuania thermophila]TCD06484.1 acyltransferase [Erythrobacteraceae bacterium CFH 75059]